MDRLGERGPDEGAEDITDDEEEEEEEVKVGVEPEDDPVSMPNVPRVGVSVFGLEDMNLSAAAAAAIEDIARGPDQPFTFGRRIQPEWPFRVHREAQEFDMNPDDAMLHNINRFNEFLDNWGDRDDLKDDDTLRFLMEFNNRMGGLAEIAGEINMQDPAAREGQQEFDDWHQIFVGRAATILTQNGATSYIARLYGAFMRNLDDIAEAREEESLPRGPPSRRERRRERREEEKKEREEKEAEDSPELIDMTVGVRRRRRQRSRARRAFDPMRRPQPPPPPPPPPPGMIS
jgi:hypothetical protein